MKESYLKYYKHYSLTAPWKFYIDSLLAPSRTVKLSLINRQRDYLKLSDDKKLLEIHYKLNLCIYEATKNWKSYDYGEGYFYQGLDIVNITGRRDTRGRVRFMELERRLKNKKVLEIGCNSGFLSITVADSCEYIFGFDINPHIIKMGQIVAEYLKKANCTLITSSFEDLKHECDYDVVLSFANHHTYDNNTRHSIEEYFQHCCELLKPNGMFLFESHPPQHEGSNFENVISLIEKYFKVEERKVNNFGTYLDRNRTFIAAKKR